MAHFGQENTTLIHVLLTSLIKIMQISKLNSQPVKTINKNPKFHQTCTTKIYLKAREKKIQIKNETRGTLTPEIHSNSLNLFSITTRPCVKSRGENPKNNISQVIKFSLETKEGIRPSKWTAIMCFKCVWSGTPPNHSIH